MAALAQMETTSIYIVAGSAVGGPSCHHNSVYNRLSFGLGLAEILSRSGQDKKEFDYSHHDNHFTSKVRIHYKQKVALIVLRKKDVEI